MLTLIALLLCSASSSEIHPMIADNDFKLFKKSEYQMRHCQQETIILKKMKTRRLKVTFLGHTQYLRGARF